MRRATFYFTAADGGDPVVFETEAAMKRIWARTLSVLRNPVLRPVEVWAIRAAVTFVAAKLGIDAAHLLR